MEIKLNEKIKDLKGEVINSTVTKVDLTLKEVMTTSLLSNYKDENTDGKEKFDRFQMAMKIENCMGNKINFKTEEVNKIKTLIGKSYATIIVGRAFNIIEAEEDDKE